MAVPLPHTCKVGCVLHSNADSVFLYAGEYSKERYTYVRVRTQPSGAVSISRYCSNRGPRVVEPIRSYSGYRMVLHADDGPTYVVIGGALDSTIGLLDAALTAYTRPDVIEYKYYQHDTLTAPPGYDGSVVADNRMLRWFRDNRQHRDPDENGVDRPAQIVGRGLLKPSGDPDRIEYSWSYYVDGECHRAVGPCDINHCCNCGRCPLDVEKSNKFGIRLKAGPPYRLEWRQKGWARLDGPTTINCDGTQCWGVDTYPHRPYAASLNGEIQWSSLGVPEVYSRYSHRKFPAAARKAARAIVACSVRPNFLAVDLRTWIVEVDFGYASGE
jgi:hypothetical protein